MDKEIHTEVGVRQGYSKDMPNDIQLSRDEVKAQREAKKAAKAARKHNKGSSVLETSGVVGVPLDTSDLSKVSSKTVLGKIIVTTGEIAQKIKAELKAERRTLQESQRAEKLLSKSQSCKRDSNEEIESKQTSNTKHDLSNKTSGEVSKTVVKGQRSVERALVRLGAENKEASYSTIPEVHEQFQSQANSNRGNKSTKERSADNKFWNVHPKFQELGVLLSHNVIRGSNQRTTALLKVVVVFLKDYKTPEGKVFQRDILTKLKSSFDMMKLHRPFAVGMTNAVDGLYAAIQTLGEASQKEYKESIEEWCNIFIDEKIDKAVDAIAQKGNKRINNGDKILVYSVTDAIYQVLKLAGNKGKKFEILFVKTRSDDYIQDYKKLRESIGKDVFQNNVRVSFINLSNIATFISTVDKVFLGGHALFSTGGVMAHAGTSIISMCAIQNNIPTLFFCEIYKFCDKFPAVDEFSKDFSVKNASHTGSLDGFCVSNPKTTDSGRHEGPLTAKVVYDITPANLVTCVITDIGILPSSIVPVILRVQETRSFTK